MTPDGFSTGAPKPEREKEALRAVIRATNADILAVQEIGGPAFVEELRRDLSGEGLAYPHTATLEGPDPHRRMAFLSKCSRSRVRSPGRDALKPVLKSRRRIEVGPGSPLATTADCSA